MNAEIKKLLDDVTARLNTLKDSAMREIEEAQDVARANVTRRAQAQEELAQVEATIAAYEREQEQLPNLAYRAGLDEDWAEEDRLKERYRNLKPALEALEEQRHSLREELRRLNPNGGGHLNDVTIEQYARVASVAHGPRAELEALKKGLHETVNATVGPVVQKHDSLRGTVEALSRDRNWDTSPVGRGAVR